MIALDDVERDFADDGDIFTFAMTERKRETEEKFRWVKKPNFKANGK